MQLSLNEYKFFADLIIDQDNRIEISKLLVEKTDFIKENFIIFPVIYKGYINSFVYLLIPQLYYETIFDIINQYIYPALSKGLENLYKINFKKLNLEMSQSISKEELNKINTENLFIYCKILNVEKYIYFYIMVPFLFLIELISALFKVSKEKINLNNIQSALNYIKFRLYRDSFTSFWDLSDFLISLSDKEIQKLINILLSNNIIEETMLAALIAGFSIKYKNSDKLLRNLSKNLRQEIEKNILLKFPDYRWIEECFYLVKSSLENLIFEDKLEFSSLKYLKDLKSSLKEEIYRNLFQNKKFSDWLKEAEERNVIDDLKLKTPNKILTQALSDADSETVNIIAKTLTKEGQRLLMEDILYEKNNSNSEEIFKAKIAVIENLKDIYYEKESKKIENFERIILGLNESDLKLLIDEVGILNFAQATINSSVKLKNHIKNSISGVVKNLLIDIYSGKVRFKSAFGEITINKKREEVLKTYYFLKGEGKIFPDE